MMKSCEEVNNLPTESGSIFGKKTIVNILKIYYRVAIWSLLINHDNLRSLETFGTISCNINNLQSSFQLTLYDLN